MSGTTLKTAHNQWANRPADQRFKSLDELMAAMSRRRMHSRAQDVNVQKLHLEASDEGIIVNGETTPSEPSNWAFGQLASTVGAPATYLRRLSPGLAVDCLREGIVKDPEKDRKVKLMRLESDEEGSILQAVTSPTYGRIWDADVVKSAQNIVEQTGGRFYNPKAWPVGPDGRTRMGVGEPEPGGLYASDRDVFMFLIDGGSMFDVGPRAQLNRGFFMWNSEVGRTTFGFTTFYHNGVCGNHYVFNATGIKTIKIVHRSGAPERFMSEALPELLNYANESAAPIEAMVKKAMKLRIPKLETKLAFDDVQRFATEKGDFTKTEIRGAWDCANREEGDCATLWQLTQGFTAYARDFSFIDARVDLEQRAGKLMQLVS